MRPVSGGTLAASATITARSSAATPATTGIGALPKLGARLSIMSLAEPIARSELDLRRRLRGVARGEFGHRFVAAEGRGCPDHARKRAQLGIVGTHRLDVVAARNRDAVFGALELGLKREEVLIRFQVGVVLAHRQQAPERAAEPVLRILELLQLLGVRELG